MNTEKKATEEMESETRADANRGRLSSTLAAVPGV